MGISYRELRDKEAFSFANHRELTNRMILNYNSNLVPQPLKAAPAYSSSLEISEMLSQTQKNFNKRNSMGPHIRPFHPLSSRIPLTERRSQRDGEIKQTTNKRKMIASASLSEYELQEAKDYPEIFYVPKRSKRQPPFEDSENFYKVTKGDHIAFRYEIINVLGKGSFGQVCEVWDHKHNQQVALKILKNEPIVVKQAEIETKILNELNRSSNKYIVQSLGSFTFRNHVCIAFELLHQSLYDQLKVRNFRGFSLKLIVKIAYQILRGLQFLHSKQIIHCDLKPENILMVSQNQSDIKIIDFGSSCLSSHKIHTYIQSRFYRAPEIVLGIPYYETIDTWSFGCILYELYTGRPVFPGENEQDLIFKIVEVIGLPPPELLSKGKRSRKFFQNNRLLSRNRPVHRNLNDLVKHREFADLISKCLVWDPKKRISASQALNHEFFQSQFR